MNAPATAQTRNNRKVSVALVETATSPLPAMPAAPFGALLVCLAPRPDEKSVKALARKLLEAGCGWATLHGGKHTRRLHQWFDDAIVEYQLKQDRDAEMMTSGEAEDSLEEAMRDAVWFGFPAYDQPFAELLVLVLGPHPDGLQARATALAQTVEQE